VLGPSRVGYHAWKKRGPSARKAEDDQLKVRIEKTHSASFGSCGAFRIPAELADTHGINMAGRGWPT
jgi:hypothetical protein